MLRTSLLVIAVLSSLVGVDMAVAQTTFSQCTNEQRVCRSQCRDDTCTRRCYLEYQGCNNRVSRYLRDKMEAERRQRQQQESASRRSDQYSPPSRTLPSTPPTSCPQTLSSLSIRLANYADPELRSLRTAILSQSMTEVMQNARSMGYSPAEAARLSLQQAQADEAAIPQAESCIRSSTNNPEAVIQSLRNGTYDFDRSSVPSSCARAYVVAYWGVLMNRETGAAISCFAATMR